MIYRFKAFSCIHVNVDKLLYRRMPDLAFIDKPIFIRPSNTNKYINRYKQYLFIRLSLEG